MPDPIIPNTPFGAAAAYPPSPAKLDRTLDAQHHQIINTDWSGQPINLATDVTGLLPLTNIASNTGPYLLGATATGSPVRITIGSNVTLSGNTLSAATSGGAGSGDFSTNTGTSVVSEIVLFSNATGKQGMRSTGTGVCSLASGVLSAGTITLAGNVTGLLPAASVPILTGDVTCAGGVSTTAIAAGAVTNAKLAGGITASNLVGSDIATVGTITTGVWAAAPVGISFGGTGSTTVAGARAALGLQTTTTNGDSDYQILATDNTVVLNATLTAVRTWTLPQAATVNNGAVVKITDTVAGVSGTNYVQVTPFAGDTINGSANPFLLNKVYGVVNVTKSSATNWVVMATSSITRRSFTANQTYTVPTGIKSIFVECVGGGGAGGGAATSAAQLSVGSGGGGGGYASVYLASPGASYLITIGTGGVPASGATGGNGVNTTFGSVCTATGGSGGTVLAAGTAVGGTIGGIGGNGVTGDYFLFASAGSIGIRLSATVGITGSGGASAFGFAGSTTQVNPTNAASAGVAGSTYGGGGGGAITQGAAQLGGTGSPGICLVTEYY